MGRLSGGYGRLYDGCGEAICGVWVGCPVGVGGCQRVWQGSLEVVGRLSGGCGEAVWCVWGGCLVGLAGCLECVGRLSRGCGGYHEGVGRLPGDV